MMEVFDDLDTPSNCMFIFTDTKARVRQAYHSSFDIPDPERQVFFDMTMQGQWVRNSGRYIWQIVVDSGKLA